MSEEKKDFIIHSEEETEIKLSKKFKVSLTISTILTGVSLLCSVVRLVDLFVNEWGNYAMFDYFSSSIAFFVVMLLCSVTFISILLNKRPFSKTLIYCLNAIAIVLIICSGLISFIPGAYSNYQIMASGSGFYLDGYYATAGFLVFVFAKLFHYGLEYQNRSDTTI